MSAAGRASVRKVSPPLRDRRPHRFVIGEETLGVRVRESRRAKTLRIIVGPRRPLEVIVPRGLGAGDVDAFLEEKRRWVETKIAEARAISDRPPQLGLERAGTVWLAGRELPIERRNARRAIAMVEGDRLVVFGPDESAAAAVERWYRREARRRVADVVRREAERLGYEYQAIGIRDPRTRWGSCSRRGNPRSLGGCCLGPTTCSSTSSCTSSAIFASRVTGNRSGDCSSRFDRAGRSRRGGSASTDRSCTPTTQPSHWRALPRLHRSRRLLVRPSRPTPLSRCGGSRTSS